MVQIHVRCSQARDRGPLALANFQRTLLELYYYKLTTEYKLFVLIINNFFFKNKKIKLIKVLQLKIMN